MLLPVLALLGALVPVVAAPAASAVASPWEVSVSYPVSQASLRDITCPSSTECIAVGEAVLSSNTSAAVIVATTDAGASWTTEPVPASLGSGFDTGLTTVTCPSTSVCYAFGYSASLAEVILGTTDGGSNWSVQDTIDAFGGTPDITCVSTSDCFALTDPNGGSGSGTILQTLSGGASWTSLPLPPNLPQLTSMTCTSAQNCLVVGGADVLQTSNGGTSWTVQRLGGDPPGQANPFELYGVACASSSACIAVGGSGAQGATSGGVIFTTADAGAVWSGQNVSVATLSTVACTSSLDCFAGGVQGYGAALLGSLDGGTTWTNQNIPGASALTGLSCPGTGVCFAAEDGSSTSQILVGPGAALTPSTTTVSASAASVPPGQAVTFTAAVAPATGSGSPTGTVTVEQGGSTLCTIALSNGTGSCSSAKAPVGTDTVTAAYSGDQDYAASSGSTTLIVQMASLTTIAAVPQNAAAGQQVTYAAWVSPTPGMETGTPTGTVAFAIGTTPVCVATLSNGSGSCTADDAPVGDDVVSGTYSGDEYFSGSSGSTSVTVGGTTTSVSVSSSAVAFQQSVTYSATVAPTAGTGTPSGSVTFSIGPTTLCVATLTGGSGSCSSAGAPLGAQEVAVGSYSGDQSFNASVGTTPLAVGATTTTASVQPGEVPAGGSVQYSATVVPGAGEGTPTGNVTFSFFGMPLCVAPLTAGTASCSSSAAPVGDDDVEANYSGDPQFAEASGLVALVVGPTTTTVTVSATPVPSGQPVSYSATVASSLGSGTPDGGSIVFSTDSGSVPLCTAVVSAGTAQCSASSAPVGSDIVFAAYSGDGPFAPSSGSSTLSVAGSTTTASVQPGPVAFSQSVTYSAQVVPSPGSVADGGSVSFSAGTTSTCSAPVVNGVASCMATSAPAGNDTVTATYSGDAAIGASSGTTSLVVGPTTTAVSVNPSSVPANEDTTYSATVSAALGSGVPTGTVTFSYESYQLCTATLSGGSASCTTVADGTVGPNTIVATYSGDSEFAPSAGSATLTDIKDQTAVTFTSMVDFGQTVFFSAGVNPVGGSYGPLSDGTVAFSAGATTLCTARFVSSFGSYACTATRSRQRSLVMRDTFLRRAHSSCSWESQRLRRYRSTLRTSCPASR
jgi:photosystem II stability/assembly factor-like uncharacterized protein